MIEFLLIVVVALLVVIYLMIVHLHTHMQWIEDLMQSEEGFWGKDSEQPTRTKRKG